jgi:hypothetical protein
VGAALSVCAPCRFFIGPTVFVLRSSTGQVKRLDEMIFAFCYGGALLGTVLAAYMLWTI